MRTGFQQTPSEASGEPSKYRLDYDQYISSSKWERRKVAYYAKHPRVCRACGTDERIHLHHHTYARMGHELDDDLVPLCQNCHDLVHRLHRAKRGSLTRATSEFLALNGASLRPAKHKARRTTQKKNSRKARIKERRQQPLSPTPSPPPPFRLGAEVRIEGKSSALSWARGRVGTVVAQVSDSIWQVELRNMPGSRIAVTANNAALIDRSQSMQL